LDWRADHGMFGIEAMAVNYLGYLSTSPSWLTNPTRGLQCLTLHYKNPLLYAL